LLTLENASQHLHHFCDCLSSGIYADSRPEFDFTNINGQIAAKVSLPISVDPSVRSANSSRTWKTERMAKRDAAFEAYKALYAAGLVNENLLPVKDEYDGELAQYQTCESQPSVVTVSDTLDPWKMVAQHHDALSYRWHNTLLEVTTLGEESLRIILLTPSMLPTIPDVFLHWNETKQYNVKVSPLHDEALTDADLQLLRAVTWKILRSVFGVHIGEGICDFLYLLAPCSTSGGAMSIAKIYEWHAATEGQRPAPDLLLRGSVDLQSWGLVTQQGDIRRFIVRSLSLSSSPAFQDVQETFLTAVRFPKRRDFLHPVFESENKNEAYTRTESLASASCVVDNLPVSYSILASLFPSIVYKLEVYMVANILRTTLLKSVDIAVSDLPVIVLALTSSAVDDKKNYQRLEFLGDCILKFITSLHLMAAHLRMPEGMLTGKKSKLVSNGYLARAALAAGLDRFVLYKRFTGAKWRPRYISQILADSPGPAKQEKSSKLIADVMESLIGASYLIGGFPKAFACVQVLLPLEKWTPILEANNTLYDTAPNQALITSLSLVESLVGHTFNKKELLLEALTHPTFRGLNTHCSYEREEFLGDAVLDYVVSKRLYAHIPELPHYKMHGIRTAMVNAFFLTYSMFETTVEEELTNKETLEPQVHQRALWQFLRSTSHELVASRNIAIERHAEARTRIAEALKHDTRFPWHSLALTDPPKFLCDIVESVIGAIYIDTHGSIAICEEFVRRLGILHCLERILRDGVDCLHPKERLGILAVDKSVKYVRVTSNDEGEEDGSNRVRNTGYKVQVRIGGENVGDVVIGVGRLQAETIAAWKAIAILEGVGIVDAISIDEEGEEFFDADEGWSIG
jgi:dsRNA-specific ribonuclease